MAYNPSLQPGTVLRAPEREYKIVKTLGQGGFGITYLAETSIMVGSISYRLNFAIKEHFISTLCSRDSESQAIITLDQNNEAVANSLRAFVKEARRLHDLGISHPNIVKVNEVFEANNTAYYVMQYLDGESLDAYVKRVGALSETETRELLLPLVHAVSQLHRNKVAHYDIKPQNIMLTKDENGELQPTLIDFGLAKHYDNQGHATSSIMAAGYTPGYAPVEQYGGISTYTPQCDVYSLGATIYYCVTGKSPAVSLTLNVNDVDAELQGMVSDSLRAVIVKAMQHYPNDRYADATRMFEELCGESSFDSGATVKKPKPSVMPEATKPQTPVQPEANKEIANPSPGFNMKKIGIFVAVLLVGVLGVWLFMPDGSDSGGTPVADSIRTDTAVSEVRDTFYVDRIVAQIPDDKPVAVTTPVEQPKPEPVQPEPKPTSGYINGYEYVDLGLSVKWATCNVGASSPSGYGNYYAWGETSTKSKYTESNSKTYGDSSYGNIGGNYGTDAARANWGGTWRLPTKAELKELKARCTWTWTTQGGHKGYKVKGPNGNTIFLPAAGVRYGMSPIYEDECGYYQSSTPDSNSSGSGAYGLYLISSGINVCSNTRDAGYSVRPVSE